MSKKFERPPLSDEMVEMVADRFRVLGEPIRLRVLQLLHTGEKPVGTIVEALEANQSNISKHLQTLRDSGIVKRRREGNQIFYSIADGMVFKLCDLVCQGVADQLRKQAASVPLQFLREGI